MRNRDLISIFSLTFLLIFTGESESSAVTSSPPEEPAFQSLESFVLPENCTMEELAENVTSGCQILEDIFCDCVSSNSTDGAFYDYTVYTTETTPYEPTDYIVDITTVYYYYEFGNTDSIGSTSKDPFEIIDVTAIITHSTDSQGLGGSTSSSDNSVGEIIDSENIITHSTEPISSIKPSSGGGGIVDYENVLTHPTALQDDQSGTTHIGHGGVTTPGQGGGDGIEHVTRIITYPTSSTNQSSGLGSTSFSTLSPGQVSSSLSASPSGFPGSGTSTAPWTEHAKAADSITSTSSQDTLNSTSTIPTDAGGAGSLTTSGKDNNLSTIKSDSDSLSLSTSSLSINSSSTVTTTVNPSCYSQCPDGYVAGSSLCFIFADLSSIKSYQSALSYCQTVDLRNLISLEHLRNLNDLQLLKTRSNSLGSTTWFFANGGGSSRERFGKEAQVFDINMLTAMTSPIAMTIGISDSTTNTSAICVLPQYCNISQCFVDSALNVLELNTIFSSTEEVIDSVSTTSLTCSYTKAVTTVTCGVRGNMMPNPTTISCEAVGAAQKMKNTTAQLVDDCSLCFGRGTESCDSKTDENGQSGYVCNCKGSYSMSTCWYTSDACTPNTCNGHGKCSDTLGDMKCDCDWGYEGDSCEVNKDRLTNTTDSFFSRLGNYILDFPTIFAVQTNTWTLLTVLAKSLGKIYVSNGEDDPQETHQAARAFFMTLGTSCVLFFNDPYLFKISLATCRVFFIMIHFCFMGAMIQWMLEGYNANQVVRCVHLNEWEKDFKWKRAWGIMAAPRMAIPLILLAVALAITFQSNWYYLPSTWTCLGVICNQTTSVWLSAIWIILCLIIATAAFAESSVLLTHRRPLYNLKIRQRIEQHVGILDGWVAEKCRRNTILCFVGICLLSVTWLFTILASDKRSKYFFGWTLTLVSTLYGIFSFVQGLYTDPNTWSAILWFAMKKLPPRFAPTYDPISMWTREEVKEIQKLPKEQREAMKEHMLPLNKRLFLHHKWDLLLNEKLEKGTEVTEGLLEILREEMKRHHNLNGSPIQKAQLQETFAEFVSSVRERPPRMDLVGVNAKSESVTLCAERDDGTARVTKFMLIPPIDVFQPEEFYDDADDLDKKRMSTEVDKETYKIAREEAVSQNKFMNSAIKFKYYGRIKP